MASTPDTSESGLAVQTLPFLLLPGEIRNIVYDYLDLEVDIQVAPSSSPFSPQTHRIYSGGLTSLASIRNSQLRREVLSLRSSSESVARTAAHTTMRDLITSISTAQFHNIVDLQMQLAMDFHSTSVFPVVRYAPASFAHHLPKLRRLRFVFEFPFDAPIDRIRAFCNQIVAEHPTLTVFHDASLVSATVVFTMT